MDDRSKEPRAGIDALPRSAFWLVVVVIVIAAAGIRFYGLNWDQGTHLHPDERYLTMVVSAVRFPSEVLGPDGHEVCRGFWSCLDFYWDTGESPLNPANHDQYANYVYGTLPLFTTRAVAGWVDALSTGPGGLGTAIDWLLLGSGGAASPGFYTGYSGIHLVGRALSTLMDLGALVGLIWLARSSYGRSTGLLAGALYAFAVLPIQHAHFFVVDSFATVFVVWALLFCVLTQRSGRAWLLVPAGLSTGLAVASKISVWPLAGVVALSAVQLLREHRQASGARDGIEAQPPKPVPVIAALALSGILAAIAFRSTQPYAFLGPGFLGLKLNPLWSKTLLEIGELMRGMRDVPFGHQWTARLPIVFPWRNMVFWGLGLPLGTAAWVGWGWMGWELVAKRRFAHLLPWVWGTVFFLYQATQWVKSMRYLLPVYPVFVLFAAWMAIRLAQKATPARSEEVEAAATGDSWPDALLGDADSKRRELPAFVSPRGRGLLSRAGRVAGQVVPAALLVGTVAWGLSFTSLYRRPVTRIEASNWMFEHIPTAVTLQTTDGESINVPVIPGTSLSTIENSVLDVRLEVPEDVRIASVILPKVSGDGARGDRTLAATLLSARADRTVGLLAAGTVSVELTFDQPVSLQAGSMPLLGLSLTDGLPLVLDTSVVANEHWDDPLPLRMDNKDPFWNWYRGLESSASGQMSNYDDDGSDKRRALLNWLDEADYIVLSSNRLYASIPRLPSRYPLTTEYYRVLLDGSLGFDLVAEFVSYASLGRCQFPDQENPFVLSEPAYTNALPCSIDLPPAEEAFSVYDHPTVLVFSKTPDYSRTKAQVLLPRSLADDVQWVTPRQATAGRGQESDVLLATARHRLSQEAGGTWSRIFNRDAWKNSIPQVGVVLWVLMLTLLGWVAFPLVYLVFPDLRHGAYGLGRIVGLLVWSYVSWLLASLHVLPQTKVALWLVLLVLATCSAGVAYRHRASLRTLIADRWRDFVVVDLVFLVLFLVWTGVRWSNPDLWHPVSGGEKPMDFAYLNAVIKSTWFPPYDPWFAGGNLNYYYFGFVMIGSLTEALGIVPSIAYNLAVPSLFALTGVGAYVLASNLAGGDDKRGRRAGLWGVLLVVVLGNLGEVRLLVNGLTKAGGVTFPSLIPGYPQIVSLLVGLWKVVIQGASLQFRQEWWYWDATRIIPIYPGEVGPINEFPAFTFLYGDLHAHMMALPLTQIALAIALQWGLGAARSRHGVDHRYRGAVHRLWQHVRSTLPTPGISLLLAGLTAGALRATNTWDYPTYLALMSVGLLVGLAARTTAKGPSEQDLSCPSEVTVAEIPASSQRSGLVRFLPGVVTSILLLGCAELLFRPFTAYYRGAYAAFEWWEGSRTPLRIYLLMYGQFLFPIAVGGVIGLGDILRRWRRSVSLDNLLPPLALLLASLIILVAMVGYLKVSIAWLAVPAGGLAALLVARTGWPLRRRILWFWVGTALALSLLVEAAVLKGDIGRMNTVFKFHLQVWMLLGVSAAVFVERLIYGTAAAVPDDAAPATATDLVEQAVPPAEMPADLVIGPDLDETALVVAGRRTFWTKLHDAVVVILALLVFGTGLYPAFAIPAKVRDRWVPSSPRTLDGMTYMASATQFEHGSEIRLSTDYRVIRWLQENVEGSPTIIEAQADREYLWGNRISIYTGLPSVAGWRWHQVQQRMVLPAGTVEARQQDVRAFYSTTDAERALAILQRYSVSYVVLAPYERAYMLPEGLPKFDTMVADGWLEVVYQDEASTIYRVRAAE